MNTFPFFLNVENKTFLIIGAGSVAYRKAVKLLPFKVRIVVAASQFCPELLALQGVEKYSVDYSPKLLNDADYVIAATNDPTLNHYIYQDCQDRNILVNVVDDPKYCTFIFPAYVKDGPLTIAISTNGDSPAASVYIKKKIQDIVPEGFGKLIDYLGSIRTMVIDSGLAEKDRAQFFEIMFTKGLHKEIVLTKEAAEKELSSYIESRK